MENSPESAIQDPKSLFPVETNSPAATRALGRRLAAWLEPGAVVTLSGDLGTGKTQLAKGVAGGLGVAERSVRSPTFVLAREYDGRWPQGHARAGAAARFFHLDAYRLGGPEGLASVDYETYFFGEGVCLVEWPGRIASLLPAGALRLRLEHLSERRRRVSVREKEGGEGERT
ncbi:MAG: tRNA (adenosine(37)-N6)-threonylcarbamoyltransferase complex ATPase subunit type 1 TsaE [Bacteroidetes bacterium QS_9_68_14]|nr:MAG: tRNA (adenosine(37)-N6)-threonylcarbamoyltransferase complex ATPase subunit type 1 TsaE [Bacteroidetes bacterium QS_9_68_14]